MAESFVSDLAKTLDCGVAQTFAVIGERWTLLILRNAFHGMRTFDAFERQLGISPSVLSNRLKKLTDAGVMEKRQSDSDARSYEYRLTEKGLELYPVIVSALQWGEKWRPNPQGERMVLTESTTGEPIDGVYVLSEDGRKLSAKHVTPKAGPGASAEIKELLTVRRKA